MSMDANNESETKSTLAFGTRSVRNRKLRLNFPLIFNFEVSASHCAVNHYVDPITLQSEEDKERGDTEH